MNLLGAKVYFDGRHWIAIRHTERHSKQRRKSIKAQDNSTVEQFEKAFNKTVKGRKVKKKERLLQEFLPHFDSESEATEFVETQFERLNRNRIERFKRLKRKAYLQQWHYFCTFTYADGKQTEESFRKQLMNCLYHLATRKGWRYIGAWERGEDNGRLHFHALVYIPPDGIMREYYRQALELEPQMLINYLIKEIKLYDDKVEIYFNSPIKMQNRKLSRSALSMPSKQDSCRLSVRTEITYSAF